MLNQINIMGRLTRDPELRYTGSNIPVATFRIAVDRDFGKGENGERATDFIDIVAWRQTGEFIAKHFEKGSMIAVTGRLQMRDWEDRDGNKRTSAEIMVDHAYFCGGKPSRTDSTEDTGAFERSMQQASAFTPVDIDDDGELPF